MHGTKNVKAYTTKLFNKWLKKEKISESSLYQAIHEIENGLIDANLGGSVYKKRIAKTGAGKSGGFRTILAFKSGDKMFFIYGFSKNSQSNISGRETVALKKLASELLSYSSSALTQAIKAGELIEVKYNE